MPATLVTAAYLVAGLLFILSLGGLSAQDSARRGNLFGIAGMAIAVIATMLGPRRDQLPGAARDAGGRRSDRRVAGGACPDDRDAAAGRDPPQLRRRRSRAGRLRHHARPRMSVSWAPRQLIHHIETFVGIFIGAVTFTGSVVAFGKLQGLIRSKPLAAARTPPAQSRRRGRLRRAWRRVCRPAGDRRSGRW